MKTTLRLLFLIAIAIPLVAQETRPNVIVIVDADRGALVRWTIPSGPFPATFQLARVVRGGNPQVVATIRPGDPSNAPSLTAERRKSALDFLALANDTTRLKGEEAELTTFTLRLNAASDPDLAAYLGISYADRDAPRGETVTYVVSRLDERGAITPYGTSAPTTIAPMRPPDPPADLRAVPGREGVALFWTKPAAATNMSDAVTYEVLRRESGRAVAVTPQPVLKLTSSDQEVPGAVDLQPPTERNAVYVIRALDLFGRRGPESAELEVFVPDFAALDPPAKVLAEASEGKAVVTWEAPANANRKGWKVARSSQPNGLGPALTPAPITASRFVDESVSGGSTYYYRVSAVNRRDQEGLPLVSHALPMKNARPPAEPSGLKADIKNGRVILTWNISADVVAGYHVERSIDGREWALLTPVAGSEPRHVDLLPRDTTGTLRYRIVAWSRDDKASTPSAVLEVRLPDRRPPDTPIIQSIDGTGGNVTLLFLARGGTGDATRYEVLRSDAIDDVGVAIGTGALGDRQERFVDDDALSGSLYFYRLVAVDAAGNRSQPSEPPAAIRPGTPPLVKPAAPKLRFEAKPFPRVVITIPVSPDDSVLYAIERRQGDARWQWIAGPLPSKSTEASDNTPPKRGRVSYRLVAMGIDGTPGPASDEVAVTLPE